MIHYALVCEAEHEFDGWFRSSEDFDGQVSRRLVTCPVCGSADVRRALMAPAVATRREATAAPVLPAPEPEATPGAVPAPIPGPVPDPRAPDPRAMALLEMMRAVRREVEASADYVGNRFPEEARRIHYGEAEARGIYGEASAADVEALREEGVDILPLPRLPDEQN